MAIDDITRRLDNHESRLNKHETRLDKHRDEIWGGPDVEKPVRRRLEVLEADMVPVKAMEKKMDRLSAQLEGAMSIGKWIIGGLGLVGGGGSLWALLSWLGR